MASKRRNAQNNNSMIFSAWNYKALSLGLLLVILGFSAMYIENEVYGFISLYISPIVIMAGYVTVVFAILKNNKPSSTTSSDQS